MQYNQLGTSELKVSEICLGTMTYGQQNTIAEAHQQLDYTVANGVNFIDTAEMYPIPTKAETQGRTETYIGEWLKHQQRDKLIIATKITGPGRGNKWIRDGAKAIDRENIKQAIDNSLQRLQTDYIDLYQIHWPDRYVPIFGQTVYEPSRNRQTVPIAEQLTVFADLIQAGKIRYIGLSNETPWGVCEFSHVAKQLGLPQVISIQNAYNLINRAFDLALAEACDREQIGLLAYSPLAFGLLSGKYPASKIEKGLKVLTNLSPGNEQHQPLAKGRMDLFQGFGSRYRKPNVKEAVSAYVKIARRYQLNPVGLALAFVRSRWFVTSTIIGATTMAQLQENLESLNVELNQEILAEVDAVHARYPSPAP